MATADTKPFTIFPLKHRSKEPACRFKSRDQFETDECENTGVRLDRLLVLDIDVGRLPEGVTLDGAVNTLRGMGVPVDDCPRVRTGSGGEHIYMRLPTDPPRLAARLLPCVDVKAGRGAYVVAPGSVHPNGEKYERLNSVKLRDAPAVPRNLMRMLDRPAADPEGSTPGLLDAERLEIVLQALDVTQFQDHDRWLELMMACRHACPEGETEFVGWCTGDPLYADRAHEIAGRWRSVDPDSEGGITTATLYQQLIEARNAMPDDLAPRRALAVMDFAGLEDDECIEPVERRDDFPLLSMDDLLQMEPPEWLVERAVPVGSLAVLYGPPKSAKTFLALDMALSVATGRDELHGLKLRPGRTLYVLAEGGASMMGDRLRAWLQSRGSSTGENFSLHPRGLNLADNTAIDALLEHAGSDWDLIVVDTLARCMAGDENSVKDMNAAIRGCDMIRERTGGAVLLVHHSGKDRSKGMRGSTALLGAVDSVIQMQPRGGSQFSFDVEELRHGEPGAGAWLSLKSVGASAALTVGTASCDFDPGSALIELAASVESGITRPRFHELVAEELGCGISTARRRTADAIPKGQANAASAADGTRVWRDNDASSSSPNAEVILNDRGH